MPIYFLTANSSIERILQIERRIKEVIPDLARIASLEDIARAKPSRPGDPLVVLVVAPVGDNGYFERLVGVATRYSDQIFFVLISDDISASDYKQLVRTGGADWVSAAGAPQEILEILAKRQGNQPSLPSVEGSAVVIAFVPSAGGVGNATLVTEIGVWLKNNKVGKNRRICIVDLDFQTSHVCDHLDIEPHLKIEELSSNPDRFDTHLLELFTSKHSSGLDIFAAPRSRYDGSALNVAALDAMFDMIANRYDLILVDLPVTWFQWTSEIMVNADAVIVTGFNTIPGLRQIAETLAVIRSGRNAGQVAVAINRYQQTFTGGIARRKHVNSVLGNETIFYLRDDPAAVESVNTGTPMGLQHAARGTKKEIGTLAVYCAEIKSIHRGSPPSK